MARFTDVEIFNEIAKTAGIQKRSISQVVGMAAQFGFAEYLKRFPLTPELIADAQAAHPETASA